MSKGPEVENNLAQVKVLKTEESGKVQSVK